MRYLLPLLFLILASCQGKLTDEQKKELKDEMKASEILKISEAEIIEAAFNYGRNLSDKIKKVADLKDPAVAVLETDYHVVIYQLEPGDSLLRTIEQQLIEAYTSAQGIELTDNVQKIGGDTLLYTYPVMVTRLDGSEQFMYALGIRMAKKDVILSMQNK